MFLNVALEIDKEEAYAMSVMYHHDIKKPSTMDGLLKKFTCEAGLVRKVQFYGVEDNFSTANGDENATASQQIQNNPSMIAYNNNVHAGFANYDGSTQNRLFGEEVKNLPSGIANGHFYIGLQNHGSNDRLNLGNMDNNSSTDDYFGATITNNNASLLKDGSVYHEKLSNINLVDGRNLKQYAYNHQGFDVYVQDDTFVDFIAVATCSKPNPIKDVTTIVDKFECSEKETMVKILGGKIDNFAPTGDANNPANPSSTLVAYTQYPTTGYDATAYDHHFIETLTNIPTGTISKAKFSIGYKVIGSSLYSNDTMYLGEMGKNHMGLQVYNTNISQTISGYGQLLTSDLMTPNTLGTGTVFDSVVNNRFLDIYVQDDTAVDFTQLNLCVAGKCGDDVNVDLSKLVNWTNRPSDAVENNVFNGTQYQGVWDDTLNWFDFVNAHSDEVLEIPFCACGDTMVNINNFKADNNATIKLDNTLVVSQQGADQLAMIRDDMTKNGVNGNHVDGSKSVTGTGTGVNHTLRVDAHNFGSEFGVAMDGTLKFRGHLGKCAVAQ